MSFLYVTYYTEGDIKSGSVNIAVRTSTNLNHPGVFDYPFQCEFAIPVDHPRKVLSRLEDDIFKEIGIKPSEADNLKGNADDATARYKNFKRHMAFLPNQPRKKKESLPLHDRIFPIYLSFFNKLRERS